METVEFVRFSGHATEITDTDAEAVDEVANCSNPLRTRSENLDIVSREHAADRCCYWAAQSISIFTVCIPLLLTASQAENAPIVLRVFETLASQQPM